jgi:hypothetical protein
MAFIFGLTRQYFPHLTPPDYQSITNQKTPKGISELPLTNTVLLLTNIMILQFMEVNGHMLGRRRNSSTNIASF